MQAQRPAAREQHDVVQAAVWTGLPPPSPPGARISRQNKAMLALPLSLLLLVSRVLFWSTAACDREISSRASLVFALERPARCPNGSLGFYLPNGMALH